MVSRNGHHYHSVTPLQLLGPVVIRVFRCRAAILCCGAGPLRVAVDPIDTHAGKRRLENKHVYHSPLSFVSSLAQKLCIFVFLSFEWMDGATPRSTASYGFPAIEGVLDGFFESHQPHWTEAPVSSLSGAGKYHPLPPSLLSSMRCGAATDKTVFNDTHTHTHTHKGIKNTLPICLSKRLHNRAYQVVRYLISQISHRGARSRPGVREGGGQKQATQPIIQPTTTTFYSFLQKQTVN